MGSNNSSFTHSLTEALTTGKPYREEQKVSSSDKKALIVFIPGWQAELCKYTELLNAILTQLRQNELALSWDWELLPFNYDNSTFSCADPNQIAEDLITKIQSHLQNSNQNYNKIFLFGHSFAGLIIRKAVLLAHKNANNDKYTKAWLRKICLVLLAGANRGYSTDFLPVYIQVLDKLTSNLPFLIRKGMRGSECVNEIRLSWLRCFADPSEEFDPLLEESDPLERLHLAESNSEKPLAPPTIQLIGDFDRIVKREDSFDIYRFSNTLEIKISNANHSGFLRSKTNIQTFNDVVAKVIEAFIRHIQANYENSENDIKTILFEHEPQPDCLVFLVHGIRDFAGWHETLEYVIKQKNPRTRVISVRYGYFTALQFLLPLQRRKNVRVFIDCYIQEVAKYPKKRIHIAAHSYGTYIFGRAMELQSGISVDRVYLAGSVLPTNFNWNTFYPARFQAVRNDCANGDWVVGVLCRYLRYLPWNWGDIGTAGFDGFSTIDPSNSAVHFNQFIKGDHGAALQYPATQEIADFLLSQKLSENLWQLQLPFTQPQQGQLILWKVILFVLPILLIGVFIAIIIFCSAQWLAVLLSVVITAFIFWLLLSI